MNIALDSSRFQDFRVYAMYTLDVLSFIQSDLAHSGVYQTSSAHLSIFESAEFQSHCASLCLSVPCSVVSTPGCSAFAANGHGLGRDINSAEVFHILSWRNRSAEVTFMLGNGNHVKNPNLRGKALQSVHCAYVHTMHHVVSCSICSIMCVSSCTIILH